MEETEDLSFGNGIDPALYTRNGKAFAREVFDFEERPLSYSTLKHMNKTPLHFSINWFSKDIKKKQTKAMLFGSVVDCLLTQPDQFDSKYVEFVKFKGKGSTEKNEKALEEFSSAGLTIMPEGMKKAAEFIISNLKSNPKTSWLINSTHTTQRKVNWTDRKTGLKLVIYLDGDGEYEDKPIVWDLKGVSKSGLASQALWNRHAMSMDYHLQAAMSELSYYLKTGIWPDFYHIVYEMEPPYAVNSFKADRNFLLAGRQDYRNALDRVKYCIEKDTFGQGYEFMCEEKFDSLELPAYLRNKYDI